MDSKKSILGIFFVYRKKNTFLCENMRIFNTGASIHLRKCFLVLLTSEPGIVGAEIFLEGNAHLLIILSFRNN